MDEKNNKNFILSAFEACKELQKISAAFIRGEIDTPKFLKLFNKNLALLNDYYEVFKESERKTVSHKWEYVN